jgi:hypothetical protein
LVDGSNLVYGRSVDKYLSPALLNEALKRHFPSKWQQLI